MTSIAARAMCAWISTAGSEASPDTAGMLRARSFSTSSRFRAALQATRETRARAYPRLRRLDRREHQRIERDGNQRTRDDQAAPFGGQQTQCDAEPRQNEREFAYLCETRADGEGGVERIAEGQYQRNGGEGLAEYDDEHDHQHFEGFVDQHVRFEQHAEGDEEQHGEGVA